MWSIKRICALIPIRRINTSTVPYVIKSMISQTGEGHHTGDVSWNFCSVHIFNSYHNTMCIRYVKYLVCVFVIFFGWKDLSWRVIYQIWYMFEENKVTKENGTVHHGNMCLLTGRSYNKLEGCTWLVDQCSLVIRCINGEKIDLIAVFIFVGCICTP